MEVNMEEILKKLNNLKENASKEEYDVKKLEIKYDSQEVKEIKDKMQYAPLGSYNREELKNEYDNKTSELENKEQEIKELADKMEKEFNDKKAETIDSINQEMSKYKKNKEIENLKSQRNAYSKMIENSKKDIQNILEAVNTGKDADFSRLRSARAEVAENTKAMERLDKEIDNCISLEDNKKAFSDLEYLKMRVSSYRVDELEKVANDSFLKEYGKENDNDKLLEEWEKAKNDRELEMWDEAIKENEEYDKKKFLQDWEDAIEENKEFDEIHRVKSEINPKPGTQLNPKPGTQLNPKPGTEPNPKPEKDAKITRIKIFDARNSIELVKENSDGQEITEGKDNYIKDALKNRKDIFRNGMLKDIIKVSADSKTKLGSLIKQARIKRKLNPVVLKALIDNGQYETVMGYVESVCNKKECEMLKVEHYLMNSQLGFFQKRMMNRIGKFENQIEGNVIQGLPEKQSKVAGLLGKGKRKIKNTPTTIKSGIKLAGKVISKPLKTIKKPFEAAIKVSKSVKDNLAKVSQSYNDYDLDNVKDDEPEITNDDDLGKE